MNKPALTFFMFPNRIVFGAGASERVGRECKQMGLKSVLIVTDKGLHATGIPQRIQEHCTAAGLDAHIFDGATADPDDRCVDQGCAAYREIGADGLIGLGGGSSIDTAKAIGLLQHHPKPLDQYDGAKGGMKKISDRMPALIAIPTTAGTGSEASAFAVITDSARHFKIAIGSPYLLPKLALVDPNLTLNLPRSVTLNTGLDALAHHVEGYVSRAENPLVDRMALYGIELVGGNLLRVLSNGDDLNARSEMMMAAMIGAFVYNQKFLGANHSVAHALSGVYDIPHGLANALLLPSTMRFNAGSVGRKFDDVGRALGGGDGIAAVEQLIRSSGVQLGLRNHGVRDTDLDLLSTKAFEDPSHGTNPRQPVTTEDFRGIFKAAW